MTLKKLTLPELLKNSCSKFSKNLSLNFVASGKKTYQDLYNEVVSIANHLLHLGVKKGDKVAILSANMPNWGITQFAIANIGAIAVPVLPGFCSTELQNILEHAEVKVIFVSRLLAKCLEGVKTPFLEHKILINNFSTIPEGCYQPEELDKLVPDISLNNTTPLPEVPIEEEDIASIIYTSGTTGFSKGVVLTHKNLVWDARQCHTIQPVDETYRFLSILPMAHTYENTLGLLLPLMFGAQVYYLDRVPTPKLLVPAMQKIRPTVVLSVPLIIEKIYKSQVLPKFTSSKLMSKLYQFAPARKLFNRLAGKKLMETFGGELKFFGIGGSKLDGTVEQFLREAKFPYAIGYGLTETAPMAAGSNPSQTFLQGVGPVMEGVQIKINDPDKSGQGEIWIKGPNVMKGYYKNPEATRQVIDEEGWLHTGDIGTMNEDNTLFIKGRSKSMILSANGQNIYPEEIESKLNNMSCVLESLVVERDGKLVALVYPDYEQADEAGISYSDIQRVMDENKEVLNTLVAPYEQVTKIMLWPNEFEKTPKKSIKRFLYNR